MTNDALSNITTRSTPQMEQARPDQVKNSAGGYVFSVDDRSRALRFLILGTDGGTYYTSEKDLTKDNAAVILKLAETDGEFLVELIKMVSLEGRAPRQNPTLFALAACTASKDIATRRAALAAIKDVCRTGTHLFIFARYAQQFRGWGRGLREAVADWYTSKPVDNLALQLVKYRQREEWTHGDLLRLSHPVTSEPARRGLFQWALKGDKVVENPEPATHNMVAAFQQAQRVTTPGEWAQIVTAWKLPWEALPDAALGSPEVWEALLPSMGYTALIRQLGRLSRIGLVAPMSNATKLVVDRLADGELLRKARIHPLAVLVALVTYGQGHGFRGSSSWTVVPQVVEALDAAFYEAFGTITPADKRTLVALDVSGSMASGNVCNSPMVPYQAEAAMAMTTVRTESQYFTMAFSQNFVNLPLTPSQRLDDVMRLMAAMPFERTDCSVPMTWATKNKVPVDTFQIFTDNETWSGGIHPFQALRQYRDTMGIDAKLIVVGMTSTGFSIADPTDRGMLDVVGFDTAAPELMSSFSRGEV